MAKHTDSKPTDSTFKRALASLKRVYADMDHASQLLFEVRTNTRER